MSNDVFAVPSPTLPVPNAFDFWCAARKALLRADDFPFAIVTKAFERDGQIVRPIWSCSAREELLRQNARALQLLCDGFGFACCCPPLRSGSAKRRQSGFQLLARLLVVEALVFAEHGNLSAAVNSALSALRFGVMVMRGADVSGAMLGISCQGFARACLRTLLPLLSSLQAREAARELRVMAASSVSINDVWQEQRWQMQATFNELLDGWRARTTAALQAQLRPIDARDVETSLRAHLKSMVYAESGRTFPSPEQFSQRLQETLLGIEAQQREARAQLELLPHVSELDMARDYAAHLERSIAFARLPYAQHATSQRHVETSPFLPPETSLPDCKFADARLRYDVNELANAFLIIEFALQSFLLERGEFPKRLEELTPVFLLVVPRDPFAPDAALRYRREVASYTLYSVGPDARDDGGRPVTDGTRVLHASKLRCDSVGDLVAGVSL